MKQKILKRIASEILLLFNNHFYNYLLDIIDTKFINLNKYTKENTHIYIYTYLRYIYIVTYDNKALEVTHFPKIFNHPDIIKTLPYTLQEKESIPTVTYKPVSTMRNNVLNHNDVLNLV